MLEYDEKRNFLRMQASCKMRYRAADEENFRDGTCVNISGSGLLFETEVPAEPGRALEVHLEPDHKITPPLTAYIEVVRCDLAENGLYYIAGAIKGIKSE